MEYDLKQVERIQAECQERKDVLVGFFKQGAYITSGSLTRFAKDMNELDNDILKYYEQAKIIKHYLKKIKVLEEKLAQVKI